MDITITINTDNAAFEDYPEDEVSRILQRLCRDIRGAALHTFDGQTLRDINGNTVGQITVSEA